MYTKKFCEKTLYSLLILALGVSIYNLLLLQNYSPSGYKIDIYSQLPSLFWKDIILSYFIGCILLLQNSNNFKKLGIFVLLFNYLIIYLLPYEFGYYSYGLSDELSHNGELKSIISTGHIDPLNIYPWVHLIYTPVSLLSNIPPNVLSLTLPVLFSLLFILGIYIFSKNFIYDSYLLYLVFPISLVYYFGHFHFSNIPDYSSFALIPLKLYIIHRYITSKNVSNSILLLISIIVMPFEHPFTVLLFLYLFLLTFSFKKFIKISFKFYTLILLFVCTFGYWFISSRYIATFSYFYRLFIEKLTEPTVLEGFDKISKIDLNGFELIKFMLIYQGRYLIPFLFVLIFLFSIFRKRKEINHTKLKIISSLTLMLISFSLFQLFLVANPFISHSPDRLTNLNYSVVAMIPLFAMSLSDMFLKSYDLKSLLKVCLTMTIVFSLSVYGVFYSPYILHPNIAVTYNEVYGMEWLFNHKGDMKVYDVLGEMGFRHNDLLYGWSNTQNKLRRSKDIVSRQTKIEDHFGYDKNKYYNISGQYIVISSIGELLYQTVYKDVPRYKSSDFKKFKRDPNVSKIYDSLNIEIYGS